MRYLWTLFAGFLLGIYSIFFAVVHIKALRKPVIDMIAKVLTDWIYGASPDTMHSGFERKYPVYPRGYQRRAYGPQIPSTMLFHETVDTHDETVKLLVALQEMVENYGRFSVADFKTALGIETNFQDSKYGWKTTEGVLYFTKNGNGGWNVDTKVEPELLDA